MKKRILGLILSLLMLSGLQIQAQHTVTIEVRDSKEVLSFASVRIVDTNIGQMTDSLGIATFSDIASGKTVFEASMVGFFPKKIEVALTEAQHQKLTIELIPQELQEVVVTGTLREQRKASSPIPVDIISPRLFKKNPTPSLFESVNMVSGVQSYMNCSVCNTGDIHINGLEGPYTMVLLDGMPIVSGLGTVYGLMGIPNSLIERIEVVKGPAAALYGSEAMAGMINVITKEPSNAPRFGAELMATDWQELTLDLGSSVKVGKNGHSIFGMNAFHYDNPIDRNGDNFTDMTLQKRLSLFNKWQIKRPENRRAEFGLRFVGEDRWGGEMDWTPEFAGTDSIYGETIQTKRFEAIGAYDLPVSEKITTQFSFSRHAQDSYYGTTEYDARQDIGFAQMYWDKQVANHSFLLGSALRYTAYDDNTPATTEVSETFLPGIFVQDEWAFSQKNTLLTGLRLDIHSAHGMVWSPRLALRNKLSKKQTLRLNVGSGFRVVNLFTEDHAALTGDRVVEIKEELLPEQSWGGTVNYNLKIPTRTWFMDVDVTGFYTHFSNRILADYDTDPNKIIYDNLDGYGITRGLTVKLDYSDFRPLTAQVGLTYMDVFIKEANVEGVLEKNQQVYAPNWSGTWALGYDYAKIGISLDFTGTWNGPMRLPVVPNDFRREYSPWFALANLQLTKKFKSGLELFGGVKNIFNFIPSDPILRPFDPFDKQVDVDNPNGYTFDANYNFAPIQGRRGFLGFRMGLN